jgi:hypothetical protein
MSLTFNGYQTRSVRFQDELEASTGELLGATAQQAFSELPIPSLYRMAELGSAQLGERVDTASAKKRIADAGLEGRLSVSDDGIASEALDILIERKRNEVKRQEVLSRSPGGFALGTAQLGTAFAASMLDPLNVGLAFVPVVGQARYLRYLANARGVLGRAGVRVGVGAVEGAVGAALIEPLVYAAKTQEQADYDFTDSLLNVAFGTVFGGGLHAVAGGVADAARSLRGRMTPPVSVKDIPDSAAARVDAMALPEREIAMRTAQAQAMQGKAVDVELIAPKSRTEAVNEGGSMQIDKTIEVDPATLRFRESEQNRTEQVRELFPPGEGYDPIVSILEPDGARTILDGHNRAAVAMERGDRLRSSQISRDEYEALRASDFDDMEIAYAALTASKEYEAASSLARQFSGSGLDRRGDQAWQELETLRERRESGPFDSGAQEIRAAAERQASPESEVTADVPAAEAAERQLAEAPPAKDPIAEQEALLADELAQLKEAAKVADIDLGDDLAEFDEALKLADEYGKAARAAVICGMAH